MKRVIAISSAALLGASLLASPVLAQVSVNTGLGVGVEVGDGQVSGTLDTSGSVGTDGLQINSDAQADVNVGDGDVNVGADVNADADVNAGIDTDTTAAVGASFDGALSAMSNNSASATSISAMTDVSSVNVIRISELENADMDAFTTAEADNRDSIGALQSTISGNAAVMAALEAQSIDPSTVVAADVAAGGSLTVYVQ